MAEMFRSYPYKLSTTGATYLATGVTGTTGNTGVTLVRSILVANADASNNASVTIQLHRGGTGYAILANSSISTGTSREAIVQPLVLVEGDSLSATASAANRLEVVVSALEIT